VGSGTARDREGGRALGALSDRVLVTLGVGAAFAAGSGARVSAACAVVAALESEAVVVGTAHGIGGHARMPTASLVARTMGGEAAMGAGFHEALGDQVVDTVGRGFARGLEAVALNSGLCGALHETGGADGLPSNGVLNTIVFAADTALARAHITATGAAGAASEAVAEFIPAAGPTFSDADITAAGGVDSTCEVHSVSVCAGLAQFILAQCAFCHRILVTFPICAAFAPGRGAGVPTALAVFVALEIHTIVIGAAFSIDRHTLSAAAFVIVCTREIVPIVRANVERQTLILGGSIQMRMQTASMLQHGRQVGFCTGLPT